MNERQLRFCTREVSLQKIDDQEKRIHGYSAVYYKEGDRSTEYVLWNDRTMKVVERLMPGCFNRAINERHDARGLYNHNPSQLLGRVSAGTCRIAVDDIGLRYEIDLDLERSTDRDVKISIKRRDVTGSSFCFVPRKITHIDQDDNGKELWIRQVEDLDLFDVGPVTFPAYEGTSTGLRAREIEEIQREITDYKAERDKQKRERDAIDVRMRMVELGL